jgi:hypothetical protein
VVLLARRAARGAHEFSSIRDCTSSLLKDAVLAFFNLAKRRAKLASARKTSVFSNARFGVASLRRRSPLFFNVPARPSWEAKG